LIGINLNGPTITLNNLPKLTADDIRRLAIALGVGNPDP